MTKRTEIRVPDIGEFDNVPIIEVLVAAGDEVEQEQSLLTLESDKATMDIPSPAAGTLLEIRVQEGDEVTEGDVIGLLEQAEQTQDSGAADDADHETASEQRQASGPEPRPSENQQQESVQHRNSDLPQGTEQNPDSEKHQHSEDEGQAHDYDYDLVVLGSGPGGYTAAFRAADLGLKVALIERYPVIGGVCLNVGCIPSKALLHVGQVIDSAGHLGQHGVHFGKPEIELDGLRHFKEGVVGKLTGGLAGMAKKRKVDVLTGYGRFSGTHEISLEATADTPEPSPGSVTFNQCIIAAGSRVIRIPGIPWDDERVMDSTGALELQDIPERLLIIGGGIIGLEMACVYRALGSAVTVVEMLDHLMSGADPDLVQPLKKHLEKTGVEFLLSTRVAEVHATDQALSARFEGDDAPETQPFDRVLVCVGRRPNGDVIDAEQADVDVDDKGFIAVDGQLRTNQPHIFAIGDLIGQPMLAHKASYEGKVAAEVAAGHKRAADARTIPSVAYTDPEVAWVGITEAQAKAQGLDVGIGKFPWAASGRALGMDRSEGSTKLIFDQNTKRVIGGGVVGMHAGDLIAEIGLAIEMGATAEDIGLTIHPHPTLSESVMMAAEMFEGTITDLYAPKRR